MSPRKSSVAQEPQPKTSELSNSASQMTFTEDEVSRVAGFVNMIAAKAVFNGVTMKEAIELGESYKNMVRHVKRCESHIMELKSVYEAPK